jgi:voltage-gated potassium channel
MAKFLPKRRRKSFRIREAAAWREDVLYALVNWRRNQILPILAMLLVAWFAGATVVHLAERGGNPAFDTWGESFWNVWVALVSGPNEPPKTTVGRLTVVLLMGVGVCLIGLFTGSVASILVENRLRRREVSNFEMEDHLVLCNWAPRGMEWIRQVHSKVIQDKRPVVIIHDDTQRIDLPDTQDDPAFNDVYIVKGDPTNEVILRRARVPRAHSVVVLTDDRQGEHADGKTILTCVSIRNICRGEHQPNVAVECRNPNNRFHLSRAGADEIISSDELGLRLLARTALFHGMTRVYQELLTVGRDANEMYVLPVPEELVGRDFNEVSNMFLRYRGDRRSCLLIGLQRAEQMILNPIGDEAGPLQPKDEMILLSRVLLTAASPLPVSPPLQAPAAGNKKAGASSSA